jgi:hypothetical protein
MSISPIHLSWRRVQATGCPRALIIPRDITLGEDGTSPRIQPIPELQVCKSLYFSHCSNSFFLCESRLLSTSYRRAFVYLAPTKVSI